MQILLSINDDRQGTVVIYKSSLWASAAEKASFNAHIDPSTIRPLCTSWKQTYAVLHGVQLKKQKEYADRLERIRLSMGAFPNCGYVA